MLMVINAENVDYLFLHCILETTYLLAQNDLVLVLDSLLIGGLG